MLKRTFKVSVTETLTQEISKMLKLVVAYKISDLFGEWNYVTREEDDFYAFEYRIAKLRYNHNNPEYFKKLVFSKLSDTTRQSIQELGDLEFDALVFVDETKDTVWLRYQDETIKLEDFRTKEEQKIAKINELEHKYCNPGRKCYLESREDLDDFLAALETFDKSGNYDEIEVMQFIAGSVTETKNFPILVLYKKSEEFTDDYSGDTITKHYFTLVDDSLGR